MYCLALVAIILIATSSPVSAERIFVQGPDGHAYKAYLRLPDGAERSPVVMMIPGTAGVDRRQKFYRKPLLAQGIGTFVLDTKTGVYRTYRDRPKADHYLPVVMRALRMLRKRPDIDPGRIAIMGWSFGGMIAMRFTRKAYADELFESGEKPFGAHVGIYGGCHKREHILLDAPILLITGLEDTIVSPERCERFKENYPRSLYSSVRVVFLENAHHGFDKKGVNRNRRGRIMRWNAEAATRSLDMVTNFFVRTLIDGK